MRAALREHRRRLLAATDFSQPMVAAEGRRFVVGLLMIALATLATLPAVGGYHAAFLSINAIGRDLPEAVLQSLTYCGDTMFALAFTLIFAARWPRLLWTAVIAALIAGAISQGAKSLIGTARPCAVFERADFFVSGPCYRTRSFPSGHTTTIFTAGGVFLLHLRAWWAHVLIAAACVLVGLSRIWVGAHWPEDVAFGAAIGCLSVLLAEAITRRWSWGYGAGAHLLLAAILAGCAVAMIVTKPPYLLAWPWGRLIAAIALLSAAWHYGLKPRRK